MDPQKHDGAIGLTASVPPDFRAPITSQELVRLMALNQELLEALQTLVTACDTGHRDSKGAHMGVRTPDKAEVEFARTVLSRATGKE